MSGARQREVWCDDALHLLLRSAGAIGPDAVLPYLRQLVAGGIGVARSGPESFWVAGVMLVCLLLYALMVWRVVLTRSERGWLVAVAKRLLMPEM